MPRNLRMSKIICNFAVGFWGDVYQEINKVSVIIKMHVMEYKNIIKEHFLKCRENLKNNLCETEINNQKSLLKFANDFYKDFFSQADIRMKLTKSQDFMLNATLSVVRSASFVSEGIVQNLSNDKCEIKSGWLSFINGVIFGGAIVMFFVNWVMALIMLLIFMSLVLLGKYKCNHKVTLPLTNNEEIVESIEKIVDSIDDLLEIYTVQVTKIADTFSK